MQYLSVEEILLIHEYELKRYGGTSGIRSIELLESAAYRPQTSYGGEDKYITVFQKAASLMHALIKNHPFLDGNKRTGMVAGVLFMERNGYSVELDNTDIIAKALEVANGKIAIKELAKWLKKNAQT